MAAPSGRLRDALQTLARHRVDFILVGGVAAVVQGASISTFDLDIVHSRSPDNIRRLLDALAELQAHYRDQTGRRLAPVADLLAGDGHHLLLTTCGPLDVLGTIGCGHAYEELLPDTVEQSLGAFSLRVLDLPALIRIKEETARDKDRAVLAVLRRTLAERERARRAGGTGDGA